MYVHANKLLGDIPKVSHMVFFSKDKPAHAILELIILMTSKCPDQPALTNSHLHT